MKTTDFDQASNLRWQAAKLRLVKADREVEVLDVLAVVPAGDAAGDSADHDFATAGLLLLGTSCGAVEMRSRILTRSDSVRS